MSDKLYISNIAYISIGQGGGTNLSGNTNNLDSLGQYNFQDAYDFNSNNINPLYNSTEKASDIYLYSSRNNHYWYGALSTANYQLNKLFTLSGGVDLRYYKGEHYREVYDLLGGDYAVDEGNNLLQEKN